MNNEENKTNQNNGFNAQSIFNVPIQPTNNDQQINIKEQPSVENIINEIPTNENIQSINIQPETSTTKIDEEINIEPIDEPININPNLESINVEPVVEQVNIQPTVENLGTTTNQPSNNPFINNGQINQNMPNPNQDPASIMVPNPNMENISNQVNMGNQNTIEQVNTQQSSQMPDPRTLLANDGIENVEPIEQIEQIEQIDIKPIQEEPKKPKKKKSKLPILIVIILLIALAIGCVYFYFKSINVYEKIIDNEFESLKNSFTMPKTSKTTSTITWNVDIPGAIDEDKALMDIFNKITATYNYQYDADTNTYSAYLKTNYDSKELINMDLYYENNMVYLLLENIYDKYIKLPIESDSENLNITNEDLKQILESIKNALTNSIKKDYIKRNLSGNKWKNTLEIDGEKFIEILNKFQNELKNDKNFIKVMAKISGADESDIINSFEPIESVASYMLPTITIDVYTDLVSNKIISSKITIDEPIVGKIKIEINEEENTTTAKIIFESLEETTEMNLKIVKDDTNTDFELTSTNGGLIKIHSTKTDNQSTTNINIQIEEITFKCDINSQTDYNLDIEPVDTTNSVDYIELSDIDYEQMLTKLQEKEGIREIIEAITSYENKQLLSQQYSLYNMDI